MDNEAVNKALHACRDTITSSVRSASPFRNQLAESPFDRLQHLLWMIDEAHSWGPARLEKKFRWLGFVQGALWEQGLQSVEDSKRQNMPEGATFKEIP